MPSPSSTFTAGSCTWACSGTIACRLAATGHRDLRSFSAAFPGSSLDESADAAATAKALGLPNERIVVPTTIRDDFAEIVATLDEPFADPSSFPSWYLARATELHVKVVLGGDGGDELFAGYKRVAKHVRNGWRDTLRVPLPVLLTTKVAVTSWPGRPVMIALSCAVSVWRT
jgi:asparagine synthase (glutamine-hydrolysing)